MSRKDYILIAGAVRKTIMQECGAEASDALLMLAEELAARLARDNPRFDPKRFLDACRTGDGF